MNRAAPDRMGILAPAWRDRVAAAVDHLAGQGFAGRVGLILDPAGLIKLADGLDEESALTGAAA